MPIIPWYEAMACDESDSVCYTHWKTIHICALVPSTLSMIACVVIIATAIKYYDILSKTKSGAQFPIFLSIADLTFEIFHGGDHLHSVTHGFIFEDPWCTLFGCMKPLAINCQTMWALGIGLYLNRSVFREAHTPPSFGQHNLYLHIACWGIPLFTWILGFIFNVYGPEGPWCGVSDPIIDLFLVDLWVILTILILLINYGCIIQKLKSVVKSAEREHKDNVNVHRTNERIGKVIRVIGLYPIAYFTQWLPYGLYKIHVLPRTYEAVLVVVLCGNCGGVFNFMLYGPLLFNQIKANKHKMEKNVQMAMHNKHSNVPTGSPSDISPSNTHESV